MTETIFVVLAQRIRRFQWDNPIVHPPNKLLERGYVKERLQSPSRTFYGRYKDVIQQYEAPFHKCLNTLCGVTILVFDDNPQQIKPQTKSWPYSELGSLNNRIIRCFHRAFATSVACRQGTLTPPETCSRPIWKGWRTERWPSTVFS